MKNKLAFWLITSVLIVLVIYTLATSVVLPVITKKPLPKVTASKQNDKEKKGKANESGRKDGPIPGPFVSLDTKEALKKLFELRKKENLLQSRLELASEDSMYLVIDLVRNSAILEIKGIELHECKIIHSDISNSIKKLQIDNLLNWMAEPFNVRHIDATIPKISFIEKIAPKDTIEANKVEVEPKMPKLEDVYIVMDLERNLRLVIKQEEKPDEEGKKLISALKWKYQEIEIRKTLQSLTKFNRQPAIPQISIVLPKSDATILYKALPVHFKLILRM